MALITEWGRKQAGIGAEVDGNKTGEGEGAGEEGRIILGEKERESERESGR